MASFEKVPFSWLVIAGLLCPKLDASGMREMQEPESATLQNVLIKLNIFRFRLSSFNLHSAGLVGQVSVWSDVTALSGLPLGDGDELSFKTACASPRRRELLPVLQEL